MIESHEIPLLTGERIIWQGQPYSGPIFRPIEIVLIPFSLFWGGYALFWNASVWFTDVDLEFKLFGLPFLAVGIYVTIGRFLIDMKMRRNLAYLVTSKRILIKKRSGDSNVKSCDINRLPALELDERPDGQGTIRFGTAAGWFSGYGFGIWQPTLEPTLQFIRIANVRSVYELIQAQSDK